MANKNSKSVKYVHEYKSPYEGLGWRVDAVFESRDEAMAHAKKAAPENQQRVVKVEVVEKRTVVGRRGVIK